MQHFSKRLTTFLVNVCESLTVLHG
jgi:hypothetical protein